MNDEKRIDSGPLTGVSEHSRHLTPRQRREGLHSSEEMKKRDKDEKDNESIQWEPNSLSLKELDQMMNQNQDKHHPLTTLDTAIDWQQIQEVKYEDQDENEDEDMPLYSPRYEK